VCSTTTIRTESYIGYERLPDGGLLIGCHAIECFRRVTAADAQYLGCALAEQALRAKRCGFLL
jgi:hypothetical protein